MRHLIVIFALLLCCLSRVYALDYNGSNYIAYESVSTNGLLSLYVVPRAKLNLVGLAAGTDSLSAMFFTPTLPTSAAAYQISLSSDGHLNNPVIITNLTAANVVAQLKNATLSKYKIYNGHFKNGSNNTWLLQASDNRDSILLDADINGTPFIYFNFGNTLDQSKQFGLVIQDVDNNGFDDIVTATTQNYTKVAFYSSGNSELANNVTSLTASQLGLLINDNDPYSVAIGEYYRVRRGIPTVNIIHLQIPANTTSLDRNTFASIKATVDASLPSTVQAMAIAWSMPYAVGCNSITSAFARGFDAYPCDSSTSNASVASPYYNSPSAQPYTDFKMRPAMLLAAHTIDEGKALIDRGVASDGTQPYGTAYIMKTSDGTRSKRAITFPSNNLGNKLSPYIDVIIDNANYISGTTDALFYFQGLTAVPNITTNSFPNGAIADTLTSYGGIVADSSGNLVPAGQLNYEGQGSVLDFIAGGVTGTFGTVTEPAPLLSKFPDPSVVVLRYTNGETLLEAYWKSISQTFQGLFIGEPLARPWQ